MKRLRSNGTAKRGRFGYYEWEGKNVRVYDSARNSLLLLELFGDEEVDPLTKEWLTFELLFVDPQAVREGIEDLNGLLTMLLWELCGLDLDDTHDIQTAAKAFDWEEDREVISTSFWLAYARPFSEIADEASYREVLSMIGMIPHETPLGQAIYYRTAEPPTLNEHNREQVQQFYERQEYWAFKDAKAQADRMEAMNNRATDMFNSLARLAKSHG